MAGILDRGLQERSPLWGQGGGGGRTGHPIAWMMESSRDRAGIEPRPGGPLTAGLNSGSPSPSLPSSVSRSRSNTAAMAAPAPRAPRRLPSRALTDRPARALRHHSATAASRTDDARGCPSREPEARKVGVRHKASREW